MPLLPLAQPTSEPLTVGDVRDHLRVDGTDEDTLLASLIVAARVHLERRYDLSLMLQSWTYVLDVWPPTGCVYLPRRPLQSVDVVRVLDADGGTQVVSPASYVVDRAGADGRLFRRAGTVWPAPGRSIGGIEIDFVSGFGPHGEDVPAPIKQALKLLVAHWYERRELIEVGSTVATLPTAVETLMHTWRRTRL